MKRQKARVIDDWVEYKILGKTTKNVVSKAIKQKNVISCMRNNR